MAKSSKAQQRRFTNNADESQKAIIHLLQGLSRRHGIDKTWSDWVEMSAIAMANAVDKSRFDAREKRYLEIVAKYEKDEVSELVQAFAHLVHCWDIRVQTGEYGDVLGSTFMMLDMGNANTGQFFTPYEVSSLMGRMLGMGQEIQAGAKARGFARLMEPTCGAGGMIIAAAHAMRDAGLNYQEQLHVTAIDIDVRCVHMTYLQLALLHIPAVVAHGNALSGKEWDHWYTPAHVMGQWGQRLRQEEALQAMQGLLEGEPSEPVENEPGYSPDELIKPGLTAKSQKAAQVAAAAGQMQLF